MKKVAIITTIISLMPAAVKMISKMKRPMTIEERFRKIQGSMREEIV